jgi:hypothetical protein
MLYYFITRSNAARLFYSMTGFAALAAVLALSACSSGERTVKALHDEEKGVTTYATDWMRIDDADATINKAQRYIDVMIRGRCTDEVTCTPDVFTFITRVPSSAKLELSSHYLYLRTEGYSKTWGNPASGRNARQAVGQYMTVEMRLEDLRAISGDAPVEGTFAGFDFRLGQGDRAEIRALVEKVEAVESGAADVEIRQAPGRPAD